MQYVLYHLVSTPKGGFVQKVSKGWFSSGLCQSWDCESWLVQKVVNTDVSKVEVGFCANWFLEQFICEKIWFVKIGL